MRKRLYTARQVRLLDARALEALGISSYELMCRAGAAAFADIREAFPECRRWLILCGAGNNAGDGYVVARLARAGGIQVDLVAVSPVGSLRDAAARAATDWLAAGGTVMDWPRTAGSEADLAVDALLGTGLSRPVSGAWSEAIEWLNARSCPRVALDIPSGLSADTGAVLGTAVRAVLTVTFVGRKPGLYTGDGPDHCGAVSFQDLGVPAVVQQGIEGYGILLDEDLLRAHRQRRRRNAHKGEHGHVLVIGGAAGMSGAPRLAGEAALRSGAGLVTLATHPVHAHWINLARPELMTRAVGSAADLRTAMDRATVLAIGPGLGQDAWARELLKAGLETSRPLVLDADALNLLAGTPVPGGIRVMTPHPGEAARLLACSTADIQADRIEAARELARRHAVTAVLKGCGTIIAEADGRWAVCALGNPGMATAGSGDVLTGVIAGLLAQGLPAWDAACLGVTAHAAAGDLAAQRGERGLIAGDIIEALRTVLNG